MPRVGCTVRELTAERFEAFAQAWILRSVELGQTPEGARRAVADGRLADAAFADGVVVFLAFSGDDVLGFAWVADRPLSTLLDSPPVTIEEVFVVAEHRRRGVGRTLLAAAGGLAVKQAGDQIACSTPSTSRSLNRTLARLGFAPSMTCRVASPSGLLRRLRGIGTPTVRDNSLLMRRRSQRARQGSEAGALAR